MARFKNSSSHSLLRQLRRALFALLRKFTRTPFSRPRRRPRMRIRLREDRF